MYLYLLGSIFFFFKQKTAYEMRISDWSSDVCSSDLSRKIHPHDSQQPRFPVPMWTSVRADSGCLGVNRPLDAVPCFPLALSGWFSTGDVKSAHDQASCPPRVGFDRRNAGVGRRSEEHTSELQSLMRISYAVFCLKKK